MKRMHVSSEGYATPDKRLKTDGPGDPDPEECQELVLQNKN